MTSARVGDAGLFIAIKIMQAISFLLGFCFLHAVANAAPSAAVAGQYGQHDLFVQTVDGETIKGRLCCNNNDGVIIYCHRLLGGKGGSEVDLLRRTFTDQYDLLTFDFRGHRSSFGTSTAGGEEILDLRAMISFARSRGYQKIYVVGAGMGGTVGTRATLIFGNIDALVVISPSGFSRDFSPFPIKLVSDITLDSIFGKIPVRVITRTRLGPRYSAGFPLDARPATAAIPVLIIHSENDRFVKLDRMETLFRGILEPKEVVIVPGERHADDLIDSNTLEIVKEFLTGISATTTGTPVDASKAKEGAAFFPDSMRLEIEGDNPVPEKLIADELHDRLSSRDAGAGGRVYSSQYLKRQLEDVLSFRGYTRASVSLVDSVPHLKVSVTSPRINTLSIAGNRWVDEDYIRGVLRIGRDYYNAYELDSSMRRLASQPAIRTVKPRILERGDGDLDIHLEIAEQKPYRLLLSTKFTDIDKYFGFGLTWNEYNPPAFQYEARAMFGMSGHDLLTYLRASKSILGNALRFNAAYFDIIKSRDDLDYVFTRQEVHEIGGEFSTQYKITANTSIDLGVFETKYKPPKINNDLPVEPGTADGIRLKLGVGGKLPLQGAPRFRWKHTFYYQNTGPGDVGDFFFDAYQFNLAGKFKFLKHHETKTTIHAGWLSGKAPPQEYFSLGGMTTLPGYEDDSFVNTRVVLAGQTVYLHASKWVNETSIWSPVRLILTFHAGTVWGDGETFDAKNLRMDTGFELDYMETLRLGVVWPTGPLRGDSPRVYIGWGVHVL